MKSKLLIAGGLVLALALGGAIVVQNFPTGPAAGGEDPTGGLVVGQGYDTARHEWYIEVAPCPAEIGDTVAYGDPRGDFLVGCEPTIHVVLDYDTFLSWTLGERYTP